MVNSYTGLYFKKSRIVLNRVISLSLFAVDRLLSGLSFLFDYRFLLTKVHFLFFKFAS
jgi:hypothetical protein